MSPDAITVSEEYLKELAQLDWEINALEGDYDNSKAHMHYGNLLAFLSPKDLSGLQEIEIQQRGLNMNEKLS